LERTDATGSYTFAGLATGTYFVGTEIDGYFDELYDDLPCPTSCNVTAGTPISVTFGATATGIDFELGDPPDQPILTVTRAGVGTGTVTSAPAGIDCGADCSEPYPPGTVITLTAAADAGAAFTGWTGGGCSGTGTCVVALNIDTTVTATFDSALLFADGFESGNTSAWSSKVP